MFNFLNLISLNLGVQFNGRKFNRFKNRDYNAFFCAPNYHCNNSIKFNIFKPHTIYRNIYKTQKLILDQGTKNNHGSIAS